MPQLVLKARKVKTIHPKTKAEGLSARVVTNGKASFADICELAGLNTTMNVAELEAAGKLILQAAARELKNGKIVDLGSLGGLGGILSILLGKGLNLGNIGEIAKGVLKTIGLAGGSMK